MHQYALISALSFLVLTLAACGGSPLEESYQSLNDTGVDSCHRSDATATNCPDSDYPNQDGDIGRDAQAREGALVKTGGGHAGFDFSKLDSSGVITSAASWACVKDNVTGLIWEVKSSDSSAFNYHGHQYSWFQPSGANGGVAGTEDAGSCLGIDSCDTQAYIQQLNSIQLCGQTTWRLPNVTELLSIADQNFVNPPLDVNYFPNSNLNAHWTSQTLASDAELAWYVYFTAAGNGNIPKSSRAHLRLVSTAAN